MASVYFSIYIRSRLQLIVRGGVILADNLCVTGKSCLDFKAECKLGHFLFILTADLGSLGTGSYDRHIALEDIEQLRKLINL